MELESFYKEIIDIYNKLKADNENFLINNLGQEAFEELIDKRSEYLDNLQIIEENLKDELSNLKPDLDYFSMNLIELARELPNIYPNLLQYRNKLIETLESLIESEKNLSENMTSLRDDIKKDLSHARTGKKTLNAYKPVTGYSGSHFIDSKK